MTTTFKSLSKTERLIRHLAACSIENKLEVHGTRADINAGMVENEAEFHLEDPSYWRDYFVGNQQHGSINRFWKDRQKARGQIADAVAWLFKQDAATVGRFISTAEPGELTEAGQRGVQFHINFLTKRGW